MDCIGEHKKVKSTEAQALINSGYKKRNECDRCNFTARHHSQLCIIFIDGNRLNVSRSNLRTYCANCVSEIAALPSSNRSGLVPDF